jgi:hypothetical protein
VKGRTVSLTQPGDMSQHPGAREDGSTARPEAKFARDPACPGAEADRLTAYLRGTSARNPALFATRRRRAPPLGPNDAPVLEPLREGQRVTTLARLLPFLCGSPLREGRDAGLGRARGARDPHWLALP